MRIATLAMVLRAAAVLSGFGFFVASILLGGTAPLNASASGGHFFLSSRGKMTEVSEAVFNYSRIHELVTLALVVGAIAISLRYKPSQPELRASRYIGAALIVGSWLVIWLHQR